MDNTQWYVAVIYRCGEDMVSMCMKLSGYVQILCTHVRIAVYLE